MIYTDCVFGEFEISEPVILELLAGPSLQRLKGIDQAGYRPLWVKPEMQIDPIDHSRYGHSLGVCLLLKKYGASLEEQIAGLIHDVSHSAFSHAIDYVLEAGSATKQNHQDNILESFVRRSETPQILEKYHVDISYILDDAHFPLKEKTLPDLCADRIDYSLKTAFLFGEISKAEKDYLLDHLQADTSDWFFSDFDSAKKYAELFFKLNEEYYASCKAAAMFALLGDCLKYALQKGYISQDDLYATDQYVLSKMAIHAKDDEEMGRLFSRLDGKTKFKNDPNDFDIQISSKSRLVDPLFLDNGKRFRVSENDEHWGQVMQHGLEPKHFFLKFEN